MRFIARIFLIASVAAATVWFGITHGPVPGVRADIYMKLASAYVNNPDAAGKQGKAREGVTLMNSSRLHYEVYQSTASVHQILDDFQRSMTPKEFHLFGPQQTAAAAMVGQVAPQIPFLETLMSRARFVRDESPQWGYASFLDLGPDANLDWHREFKRKMIAFSRSQRLGDLGTARTVVASPNPGSKSTTVMSYWTDSDFNLKNFDDRTPGDLPGSDVEGLPRIAPLRRLLTFDHIEDRLGFLLVMYETSLAPDAAVEAFERKARGTGWSSQLVPKARDTSSPMLFLRREHAEVQIFAHAEHGKSTVTISRRKT